MIPFTGRSGLSRAALASFCALALLAGPPLAGAARAQDPATRAAVQDLTLQDVALTFGETTVRAPLIALGGTPLSKDAALAIFSADSAEPWSARLARLDAESLTVPELRVESLDGDAKRLTVYRDLSAKGVRAGRFAELTVAGAALSGEGASEPKGSYGRLRAEEVDFAAIARVVDEPGDGKGPLQRLYAGFSITDIVVGDDEATVKIAGLVGRELAGRQTPATWSGAAKALDALDGEDAAARARLAGIAADLAEAVSVGDLEATGFSITVRGDEPGEAGIGRLAYSGAGPEAGLALSDLAFAVSGGRMGLAKLSLTGFSLAPTVAALRQLATNPDPSPADLRRLTPLIGTLALSGFGLDLPSEAEAAPATPPQPPSQTPATPQAKPPASPPSASPADPLAREGANGDARKAVPPSAQVGPGSVGARHRFGLRDAAMSFGPPRDGVPTQSRLALKGLTFSAALMEGIPGLAGLSAYGYRDLDLDLVADTAWDEAAKEVALKEVSLAGKDMGSLRLTGTLGGIGPEAFDPDAAVSGLAMLSATAKALSLTVVNGGLYERFIDAQAKHLSLKPDELRKEYVTACVIGVPVILGNSAAAKSLGAAMGKFAAKPGTLSISAKAKSGAGLGIADFGTVASPGAVLDKLDVTAKAE